MLGGGLLISSPQITILYYDRTSLSFNIMTGSFYALEFTILRKRSFYSSWGGRGIILQPASHRTLIRGCLKNNDRGSLFCVGTFLYDTGTILYNNRLQRRTLTIIYIKLSCI